MKESDWYVTVGNRIKCSRVNAGYDTQTKFAEAIEFDHASVSRWELGKAIPPSDVLPLLADKLNVSIDFLLANDIKETKQAKHHDKVTIEKAIQRLIEYYNKAKKEGKANPVGWALKKTGEWVHYITTGMGR